MPLFLPCSKNSDLRFKFFKDMGSDSTWKMENRKEWGTAFPWLTHCTALITELKNDGFCALRRDNCGHFITFVNVSSGLLPLFLMVTGSSWRLPFTPFDATPCREAQQDTNSLENPEQSNQKLLLGSRVTYNSSLSGGLFAWHGLRGNVGGEIQAGTDSFCARGT